MTWYEITVPTSAAAAEVVADCCLELGSPGIRYERSAVVAYFAAAGDRRLPELEAELKRRLAAIAAAFGGDDVVGNPQTKLIADPNWAESWKQHYRPLLIGSRFVIVPSWLRSEWLAEPAPIFAGRIPLWLDPGMAFGTGEHASTRLALALLEPAIKRASAEQPVRVLDVGTGSGILAIAAAHLLASAGSGAAATAASNPLVWACDVDPVATEVATENVRANGLAGRIVVGTADVVAGEGEWPAAPVDVVVANILFGVLRDAAPTLAGATRSGGWLVLAGTTGSQRDELASVYRAYGCTVAASLRIDGWSALLLQREDASP